MVEMNRVAPNANLRHSTVPRRTNVFRLMSVAMASNNAVMVRTRRTALVPNVLFTRIRCTTVTRAIVASTWMMSVRRILVVLSRLAETRCSALFETASFSNSY